MNWLILIIAVLIIAIILVLLTVRPAPSPPVPSDPCQVPDSELIDVTGLPCCLIDGQVTAMKYISTLDLVVAPYASYYLNVCTGFCPNGYDATLKQCVGGVGNSALGACLQKLNPGNCQVASLPVGYSGDTRYYGFSATENQCLASTSC